MFFKKKNLNSATLVKYMHLNTEPTDKKIMHGRDAASQKGAQAPSALSVLHDTHTLPFYQRCLQGNLQQITTNVHACACALAHTHRNSEQLFLFWPMGDGAGFTSPASGRRGKLPASAQPSWEVGKENQACLALARLQPPKGPWLSQQPEDRCDPLHVHTWQCNRVRSSPMRAMEAHVPTLGPPTLDMLNRRHAPVPCLSMSNGSRSWPKALQSL